MRPVWLTEAGVFGADAERLMAEVRRQGMTAEAVPFEVLAREEELSVGGRELVYGDCVLDYGTFPFCREIQLHRPWKPGAFCTAESLDCTAYFAYYGRFLLNQEYAILPGVEAIRQQQWLDEKFGREGDVFVRPTGPHKLFTGRCIYCDEFAAALAPTRYDPATLVVVAAPLVELNGFSCSGLYACELAAVVGMASRSATEAWEKTTAAPAPGTQQDPVVQEGA